MSTYNFSLEGIREKITRMNKFDLDKFLKKAKKVHKRDNIKLREIEFLLINLIAYQSMYRSIDLKAVEKVYLQLVENEWEEDDEPNFSLYYKIDFLYMLINIFNDYGHFSRSEKALKKLSNIHEKYPENQFIAYRFILALLGRSFDLWTIHYQNLEDYLNLIDILSDKYTFSEIQKNEINFRRIKLACDYYSTCNLDRGYPILNHLLECVIKSRSVYNINEITDLFMYYASKSQEQYEIYLQTLSDLLDSIFKGNSDYKSNFAFLHIDILKLYKATKNECIEEAKEHWSMLIDRLENNDINPSAKLNFQILIILLMFGCDNEIVNYEKLNQMKDAFLENISKTKSKDSEFEVFYTIIGTYGLMTQISMAIDFELDCEVPLKYDIILKDHRESYINFFSSLDNVQDAQIRPCVEQALTYCEELKYPPLHKQKLSLQSQYIQMLILQDDDKLKLKGVGMLKNLIEQLFSIQIEYIEQKLVSLYQLYIPILDSLNKSDEYMRHAQRYLTLAIKNNEGKHVILPVFHRLLPLLESNGYITQALSVRSQLVNYLSILESENSEENELSACEYDLHSLSGPEHMKKYCEKIHNNVINKNGEDSLMIHI